MKLAIMQPYFFPYIGYFQLINAVDEFILLDDVQYIRHGWINRNRILKQGTGFQYIIVPLKKHHQKTLIKDICSTDGSEWKEKILRQIEYYRKKAPYYKLVKALLEDCFAFDNLKITEQNKYFLEHVCNHLGINTPIKISSQLQFDYNDVKDKDDWALFISRNFKASEYINPIGGVELFDKTKFSESYIKLSFLKTGSIEYNQSTNAFEPNLSIIDVMMYNSSSDIKELLKDFEIV